jgi:arylsulfatase A-like enzyme
MVLPQKRNLQGSKVRPWLAVPLSVLLLLVGTSGCSVQPASRPSVILITVDTLRADHLGCYGYPRDTSPTIDGLSREGVLFERVATSMSTTLPAHTSLFTSSYPARNGVLANYNVWKQPAPTDHEDLRSVAQLFQSEGYQTAAFVSVLHLGRGSGVDAGFESFDGVTANISATKPSHKNERSADVTTDRAVNWLEHSSRDPFFLWIHYFDPHYPYSPPRDYRDLFHTDPDVDRLLDERKVLPKRRESAARYYNSYDGEIRFVDDQIKRVFDKLRELGLYDDSLIVFTADHGEGLHQHQNLEHGVIYNEQLLIPWIMKLPGGERSGSRVSGLASVIDIFPTAIAAASLPITSDGLDGIDVLTQNRTHALAEREHTVKRFGSNLNYALIGNRFKYFYYTETDDKLFDLENDPAETVNLIKSNPEVAESMRNELLKLVHENQQRGSGLDVKADVPPALVEALRDLGYVQ